MHPMKFEITRDIALGMWETNKPVSWPGCLLRDMDFQQDFFRARKGSRDIVTRLAVLLGSHSQIKNPENLGRV